MTSLQPRGPRWTWAAWQELEPPWMFPPAPTPLQHRDPAVIYFGLELFQDSSSSPNNLSLSHVIIKLHFLLKTGRFSLPNTDSRGEGGRREKSNQGTLACMGASLVRVSGQSCSLPSCPKFCLGVRKVTHSHFTPFRDWLAVR